MAEKDDRKEMRQIDRFSVNLHNRKDCTVGPSYAEDRMYIYTEQIMDLCSFECRNSVILHQGKLWRRRLGAPMGGFLSAFYAVLCFAYIVRVEMCDANVCEAWATRWY